MTSQSTSLRNKRILITGARGFVGSHLVRFLTTDGAQVEVFKGDVRTAKPPQHGAFDVVFHLAALTDLSVCKEDPVQAFDVNVMGTLAFLQAHMSASMFVYVSTLGVYGEPLYVPIDERHPTLPVEPYAASKLAAEALVQGVCRARGQRFSIARLFNVYGRGQRGSFVVPRLLEDIQTKDEVVLRSADSTRDFIYIDDVVAGLCAVADRGNNDRYNIGTGVETSIRGLASTIARLAKREVSLIVHNDEDVHQVKRSQADVRYAAEKLGWSSTISLEDGIKKLLVA